jgi:lipopolysaccharide assembly outer membrane protein LptD (OstA)
MFNTLILLTTLLFMSIPCLANIKFSADKLSLQFPHTIIATGNTRFYNNDIDITANTFQYNTLSKLGNFKQHVKLNYKKATLLSEHVSIDIHKKRLKGHDNIVLKTKDIHATAKEFIITNHEIITLKKNVTVKRNGSQIKSNELVYNLKTDTILSNERVKIKLQIDE